MEPNENNLMDWGDPIENDGADFVTLPEDTECEFVVNEMTTDKRTNAGALMALLELRCTAVDGQGQTFVQDALVLQRNAEWKLCEFFTSIGQRKHGGRIVPKWNQIVGATGRCTLKVEEWEGRDGAVRTGNKIKKYLEPVSPPAPAATEEVSFG